MYLYLHTEQKMSISKLLNMRYVIIIKYNKWIGNYIIARIHENTSNFEF